MPNYIERLPDIVKDTLERLTLHKQKAADPEKNKGGYFSASVADKLRLLGAGAWLLEKDVTKFKQHLSEAADIFINLFQRYDQGEEDCGSFITMIAYQELLNALAAGNMKLAHAFATHMGGRDKLEKEMDHPFTHVMGYTFKAFVLNDREQMKIWAPKLMTESEKKDNKDCIGYPQLFTAILTNDLEAANAAMTTLVEGHKKLSKARRVFGDKVDEALSIWGIGIANLARSRGLNVEPIPPLIPGELLIEAA